MTQPTHPIVLPPAPQDVQILFADEEILDVEVRYTGQNEDGVECWETVAPPGFTYKKVESVHIGVMPGMTTLSFACFQDPEQE